MRPQSFICVVSLVSERSLGSACWLLSCRASWGPALCWALLAGQRVAVSVVQGMGQAGLGVHASLTPVAFGTRHRI